MFNEYAFGKEECKIAGTIPSTANEKFALHINAHTRLLLQFAKAFVFISG